MSLSQSTLGARLRRARESCGLTQQQAANAIGLPRTSLLQIEAGHRAVNTLELVQLSRLYHYDLTRLVAEEDAEEEEDPLVALCRLHPLADQPEVQQHISYYLDLFEEGVELSRLLGSRPRTLQTSYDLPVPSSHYEAARQGELVAAEERRRLDLGARPIANAAALLTGQGVWAAGVSLPDAFSGLFLHNHRIGMAVLVNQEHGPRRRRFSYCHEYAHALIDRMRYPATLTGRHNSDEFIEKRANAFAGAFLLPADGICDLLEQLNKGGPSRQTHWVWDVATEGGEQVEKRNEPGSQEIGYEDVGYLAHQFMVSYEAAVYRLTDMKRINRHEQQRLLDLRSVGLEFMTLLELNEPEGSQESPAERTEQPLLIQEIGSRAFEALRRGAISSGRFLEVCEKLRISHGERLLHLARTAQG